MTEVTDLHDAHVRLYRSFACGFCGESWEIKPNIRLIKGAVTCICHECVETCVEFVNPDGLIYLQSKLSKLSIPKFLGFEGEGMTVGELLTVYDRRSREEMKRREKLKGLYRHEEKAAEELRQHGPTREDMVTSTSADYKHNQERRYIVSELHFVQHDIQAAGGRPKYDDDGQPVRS